MTDRQSFTITLHPLPTRPGQPDPMYRLRTALKRLLRTYGLRCTRIDVVEGGSHATDDGQSRRS